MNVPMHLFFRVTSRGAAIASLVLAIGVASTAAGCSSPGRVVLAPSLGPVDAARPMVVYPTQQGKACGANSLLGALGDLKRIQGANGFVEVVIEEEGGG